MVGFYKHDIPAWMDGTEALSDGAYRAYHVIVQLIMLNEGPIARNERGIAGRCNQTLKTFSRNLADLIAARKLQVVDGKLDNGRAATELVAIHANRANAAKGGKISRKTEKISENLDKTPADLEKTQESSEVQAANPLKNNDLTEATLKDDLSLKEKRREDTPKAPKGAMDAEPEGFAEWFDAYPRRDGANPRAPAASRYAAALKAGATSEDLRRAVRAYTAELERKGKIGSEFVKQTQFFLSPKERLWEHYANLPLATKPRVPGLPDEYLAGLSDDRWRAEVRTWRDRGGYWPLQGRTPPPDDPRTRVPSHILAELNIHPARSRAA